MQRPGILSGGFLCPLLASTWTNWFSMPNRAKRRRTEEAAEEWLAEAQRDLDGTAQESHTQDEPPPQYPESIADFAYQTCEMAMGEIGDIAAAAASIDALRCAHMFNLRANSKWCDAQERRLSQQLAALRVDDGDFDASVKAFHSSGVLHNSGSGTAPLRVLRTLGAFDALAWAVWALGCARGMRVPHPVRLAEQAARALLSKPRCAAALRRVLQTDTAAARVLGVRAAWLESATTDGPMWQKGEGAMLRYLRARWAEACCHVATAKAADASDPRVRAAILRWHLIGRDAAARHMAFAVPSQAALNAIGGTLTSGALIVDMGAGNGYWSRLLARLPRQEAWRVQAYDTVPPADWRQAAEAPVAFGTPDELSASDATTLLLCMPSPGEVYSEAAVEAFRGPYVAYVGEWGSGMTGTARLHALLLEHFQLVTTTPLPCMPLTRVALYLLRRRGLPEQPRAEAAAATRRPSARCTMCGAARGLRACPWTRTLLLCSPKCYAAAATKHDAAISWLCCGAEGATRPAFEEFHAHAETFLASGVASDAEWLRLAQATPQPERELPE